MQEAKQAENICTLADLPEGQVGKLLIRKSGKVQLVLGKVTLDVTMGTPCSFLQVWKGHWHPIWGVSPQNNPIWGVVLALGRADSGEGSCWSPLGVSQGFLWLRAVCAPWNRSWCPWASGITAQVR